MVAVRALLEAVEQMSPYMTAMEFQVSVEMPYNRWLDAPQEEGAHVVVGLNFRVPLDVAKQHGFEPLAELPPAKGGLTR